MRGAILAFMLLPALFPLAGSSQAAPAPRPRPVKLVQGMTRKQVIFVLGEPKSSSRKDGEETLIYLLPTDKHTCFDPREEYQVILRNGSVEKFGSSSSLQGRPTNGLINFVQPRICP